jgi:cytochrome c553
VSPSPASWRYKQEVTMKNVSTTAIRFAVLSFLALFVLKAAADTAEHQYRQYCAGCHNTGAAGPVAENRPDEELAAAIRDGLPDKGMPSFGAALSDHEIRSLIGVIRTRSARGMAGATIEAETLDQQRSADYLIAEAETQPDLHYIGYFDFGSSLCYDNVDLTGVRSIEFEYARGMNDPGRFAILVGDSSGLGPRTNLGESETSSTGGWETYLRRRVGLSREVSGLHLLCFFGTDGGGIFNLDKFILSGQAGENDGVTLTFDAVVPGEFSAAGHKFTLEKVAEATSELWDVAFLPDGTMLATQKNGQLLLFEEGEWVGAIEGTLAVWNRGHGGLLRSNRIRITRTTAGCISPTPIRAETARP